MKIPKILLEKLQKIKLFLLDFDGVMTDGFVYVNEKGEEMVRCSRRDSMGIAILKKSGIFVGVVSKETNPVVAKRCEKLKIPCWQGIQNGEGKREVVLRILKEYQLIPSQCAYMGDDVHDIAALNAVGVKLAVADAHPLVKKIADYVTSANGGNHAVREVCELILVAKNLDLNF